MTLNELPCVPDLIRVKPRYVGDHVIRHYRKLGLSELLRDLGEDQSRTEFEIIGGIGRLILRSDGSETWEPTQPGLPRTDPLPSGRELEQSRISICQACSSFQESKCTASCGCSGEGNPGLLASHCPRGLWHNTDSHYQ